MSKTCPGITGDILHASGLTQEDADRLYRLVTVWHSHLFKNQLRRRYYEMDVKVENIGIAIKDRTLSSLRVSCGWPKKVVDVPAERSVIESVFAGEGAQEAVERIARDNRLAAKYSMAVKGELYHGLSMWTLSRNDVGRSRVSIKTHSAESASVIWSEEHERVECGMAIIAYRPVGPRNSSMIPSVVNLYTDEATVVLRLSEDNNRDWSAEYAPNPMGRPLIEAMAYEPTMMRPLGQSRITPAVMSITMNKLREDMRSEVTAEFASSAFKYFLGATDEAFERDEYDAAIGALFTASKDEDGDLPVFGQLAQLSMQPHVDYGRMLAAQIAGETNMPISTFGVIHDNPASAEAMQAAERDMVQMVEHLNGTNGAALRNVLLMAQAIDGGLGRPLDGLTDDEWAVEVGFADPSMPNLASQADSWSKLASVAPWVAGTEEFLLGQGIGRVKARHMLDQKRRIDGRAFLGDSLGNDSQVGAGLVLPPADPGTRTGDAGRVAGVDGTNVTSGADGGVVA